MDSGGGKQERELAQSRFQQAQEQLERGHRDRAEELAKEALEFDSTYNEVRLWLADLYVMQDEAHLASRQLQDALYTDREDQEAWEKLRAVDPASAVRLERLGQIAPDPFVSKARREGRDDEFASLDDFASGEEEEEAWPVADASEREDLFEEVGEKLEPEAAVAEGEQPAAQPGPARWEYEQDRQYLARWQQETAVVSLVNALKQLWEDPESLLPVRDMCAHLDRSRHPEVVAAVEQCCEVLGLEEVELLLIAERCMHPFPIQDHPPMLTIPTGLIRGMKSGEMTFQIGRELAYVAAGYLAEYQIAEVIADRPTRLVGDVATALRELLHKLLAAQEEAIEGEARERLVKLAHAWQQRATLSADRAGWLCCGEVEAACRAIAKTTARSVEEAAKLTLTGFLEQFKDQEVAQLAAIPAEETPDRSIPYAAYRIQMLRWWAGTPEAQEMAQSP